MHCILVINCMITLVANSEREMNNMLKQVKIDYKDKIFNMKVLYTISISNIQKSTDDSEK